LLLKIGHRRLSFASSASSDTRSQPYATQSGVIFKI
jgi:hypothetical protein